MFLAKLSKLSLLVNIYADTRASPIIIVKIVI
jgi:hypothetical protein